MTIELLMLLRTKLNQGHHLPRTGLASIHTCDYIKLYIFIPSICEIEN